MSREGIIFLDLSGQITEDGEHFAFYDIEEQCIISIGSDIGSKQVFEDILDLEMYYGLDSFIGPLSKFINLLPSRYFKTKVDVKA